MLAIVSINLPLVPWTALESASVARLVPAGEHVLPEQRLSTNPAAAHSAAQLDLFSPLPLI